MRGTRKPLPSPPTAWRSDTPAGLVRWCHASPGADLDEWGERLVGALGWQGPATVFVIDEPVSAPPIVMIPAKAGSLMSEVEAVALDAVLSPGPWAMVLLDEHGVLMACDLSAGLVAWLDSTGQEIAE